LPDYLKTLKNSKRVCIFKEGHKNISISINPVEDDSIMLLGITDINNASGKCVYYGFAGRENIGTYKIKSSK